MPDNSSFVLFLYSKEKHRIEDLQKIAKEFKNADKLYTKSIEPIEEDILGEEAGTYAFKVTLNKPIIPEEHYEDLVEALWYRLAVLCVRDGFYPLDENGDVIYIFDPYYLQVIYYSKDPNRKDELIEIVKKLCEEVPQNWDRYGVEKVEDIEAEGEFYHVRVIFQDFLNEHDRYLLRLSFFFRLNMFATKAGFVAVNMGEDAEE